MRFSKWFVLLAVTSSVAFSQVTSPAIILRGLPKNYLPSTGQSLSVGGGSPTAISLTQPYDNRMWNGGDNYPTSTTSFAALIENNSPLFVETHQSGFANQLTAWDRAVNPGSHANDSIMASWGVSGQCYSTLAKGAAALTNPPVAAADAGKTPYATLIASVTQAASLVRVKVPAILNVHGECDSSTAAYATDLNQWQSDLQGDIKAITGQFGVIPMFSTQSLAGVTSSLLMLDASVQWPTTQILVGPKYVQPYDSSGLHMTNVGYRWLGEYYAKAYYQQIVKGVHWTPLRPTSITLGGATITIQFTGFVPPLVFDTTTLPGVAQDGSVFTGAGGQVLAYGFQWVDQSATPVTLAAVTLADATNGIVTLTLSGVPSGSGGRFVSYVPGPAYPAKGPGNQNSWGNLRDSDPLVGLDGNHLYNWCVQFSKSYPYSAP